MTDSEIIDLIINGDRNLYRVLIHSVLRTILYFVKV